MGGAKAWINGDVIQPGVKWRGKALSAHTRIVEVCVCEDGHRETLAGDEWQRIFGTMIPTIIG